MSTDPLPLSEEAYRLLLAACDDALAAGTPVASVCATAVPSELRPRLEGELAWCQLVRQLLPRATWSGSTRTQEATAPPAAAVPGPAWTRLGRFEIRRELGRGSFGVVYLAEDPRLHRQVALKVPRPEALLTPELRARFRHEAQAAAHLDHPNLVSVYEAGEEGAICYIASAYCPGVTLAAWLRQRTEPVPYREAAGLVATLADAVEHAHRRGVLHRDLKPSNVLLSSSREPPASAGGALAGGSRLNECAPKITDFGLSKLLDGESGLSGAGHQTQSGAIVGTPNYMAPEQASGQSKAVGPAADVYALGAILYEVLTGRPPFLADTVLDTLLLVRTQEPLSPARLRPKLPRDLETLCLKCLAKEPHKRYASAQALADDLHRFLAGEPIQARPASAWERGVKWARRRPALAGVLAVSGLAVLVVLAVVLSANARLHKERNAAEQAREAAEQARAQALANFKKACSAVDLMLTRVGHQRLAAVPQMEKVRRDLLEEALRFYQELLGEQSSDPALRHELGMAHRRVGKIYQQLGQTDKAEQAFREAVAVHRQMVAEDPTVPDYRRELAASFNNLSTVVGDRQQEAEALMRQALAMQEQLAADHPDVPVHRDYLAGTQELLGICLAQSGRPGEAEKAFRKSLDLWEQLVADFPADTDYRNTLQRGHSNFGTFLAKKGRLPEAERAFRRAIALGDEPAARSSTAPNYQGRSAISYFNLGHLLCDTNRPREAEEVYRQCLDLYEKFHADFPESPHHAKMCSETVRLFAPLLAARGEHAEARRLLERDLGRQQRLRDADPRSLAPRQALHADSVALAEMLLQLGDHRAVAAVAAKLPAYLLDTWQGELTAGTILAHCVRLVAKDTPLSETERQALSADYAERSVRHLREAIKKGYRDKDYLKKHPNLDAVRPREDFQKLLAEGADRP